MGLDMYLDARIYVSSASYDSEKDQVTSKVIRSLFPDAPKTNNLNYIKVSFEAAYWRKANQIHKWFVENVQEGKDDCGTYHVSKEQLRELYDTVKKVLASTELANGKVKNGYEITKEGTKPIIENGKVMTATKVAEELLPSTEGFFFGGTDYDENYIQDLQNTIRQLKPLLKLNDSWEFYYHSSW